MASDIDRLIIDLQARMGGAESTVKQLGDVVKNLNRFALGGLFGAGTANKHAIWRSSVELQDSAFLKETGEGVITTGDLIPETDLGASLGAAPLPGFTTPPLRRYLTAFAETFLHDATHGILWGTGDPTPTGSAVVADVGTIYLQKDGTEGEMAWFKEADDGAATGWTAGFFDGADRYLSNLAMTDPAGLDAHTSQVQINADLLPAADTLVDIGSLLEAFENLVVSHVITGTLGSYGSAAGLAGGPYPIELRDSLAPLGGLTVGTTTNPFLSMFSTQYLFENGTGLFHGVTDPASGAMTGYAPGWIYVKDGGGASATLWLKETAATSAVWTPVGGGGPGSVGPGSTTHLAKFTTSSTVGDSKIREDTSAAYVEEPLAVNSLHTPTNTGADLSEVTWLTDAGSEGIWRYEHRPSFAGCLDPNNNALGEFQAFLGPGAATPRIGIGDFAITINKANLAIWRRDSYAGPVLSILDESATTQKFTVNQIGDLRVIRELGYNWPSSIPDLSAPLVPKVLGYTTNPSTSLPTANVAHLEWIDMAGGSGVAGSGHVGRHVYWTGATLGASSAAIADSNITHNVESLGGDGMTQILCRSALFERSVGGSSHDFFDAIWRIATDTTLAGGQTPGVVRYERRSALGGGCQDSINEPDGEFHFFLNSGLTSAYFGNHSCGVNNSFYITPPSGYAGPVLMTRHPTTSADVFKVNFDGNVDTIKGLTGYIWPGNHGTGLQVLKNNGAGQLSWVDQVGGVSGSGTDKRVAMWTGPGSTTALTNSNIIDNTGVLGNAAPGGGTIALQANQLLFQQLTAANDRMDLFLRTNTAPATPNSSAIVRYEHGSPYDPGNTSGEVQLLLLPPSGLVNVAQFGEVHSWFYSGLRVRPASSTFGSAFAIDDVSNVKFAVEQDGNLSLIRRMGYFWPSGPGNPPPGTVLTHTTGGTLAWNPSGSVGGSGAIGALPKWLNTTGTLTDSPVTDDGSQVHITGRLLDVKGTAGDFSEILLTGSSGSFGKWSYRHGGSIGVLDSNNEARGAMQFYTGAGIAYCEIGERSASFTGGIYIVPRVSEPALLEIRKFSSPFNALLRVDAAGDLTIIKGQAYSWPPSSTTTAGFQLTNNGTGGLTWAAPGGGGLSGGTANYVPHWNTGGTSLSSTSSMYDDGTAVSFKAPILSFSPGPALVIGASFSAIGNVFATNLTPVHLQVFPGFAEIACDNGDFHITGGALILYGPTSSSGPSVKFQGSSTGIYGGSGSTGLGLGVNGTRMLEVIPSGVFINVTGTPRQITTSVTGTPLYLI